MKIEEAQINIKVETLEYEFLGESPNRYKIMLNRKEIGIIREVEEQKGPNLQTVHMNFYPYKNDMLLNLPLFLESKMSRKIKRILHNNKDKIISHWRRHSS